jgi:hypothetical protein
MASSAEPITQFLNVDLEVRAAGGLDDLLLALNPSVSILHQSAQAALLELAEDQQSLEDTVRKLVEIVLLLPPHARSIWDRCDRRRFDIGIQAGTEPHETQFALPGDIVSLVANVQGDISITVYAPPRTS